MKKLLRRFYKRLSKYKIQKQLNTIYIIAILIPIITLGTFLMVTTYRLLTNYHSKVIESDNLRVKTLLFDMTSQIYSISEDMVFQDDLQYLLADRGQSAEQMRSAVQQFTGFDNFKTNYAEIEDIRIYIDNDNACDFQQFAKVSDEIRETEWYQKAASQYSVFWYTMKDNDGKDHKFSLVRKIPLTRAGYDAVLVLTISNNYLKNRIDTNDFLTFISIDDTEIFYGTKSNYLGESQPVDIDYSASYYYYIGPENIDGKKSMTIVSSMTLYQTDSKLYVTTVNTQAYSNTNLILGFCFMIILLATMLPAILTRMFTRQVTGRVTALREEMHKASLEEYDIVEVLPGEDEISQALSDLHVMVQKIKEKDCEMYETRLNEQKLKNEQQVMEFKMLSSQINPHFLYNTLETIRMKSLTEGNLEVATAIKLLGKSMRYVLENNGTSSTTLKNELTHIEIYLIIQRMRFSERMNYEIIVEEGMRLEEYEILPLLLQPIVENAVNHGLEEVEKYGLVTISVATQDEEYLLIDIEDNGMGMDTETLEALRRKLSVPNMKYTSSIGLYNIVQRIRLFYGEQYTMTIKSRLGKGTCISLRLPLKNIRDDNK